VWRLSLGCLEAFQVTLIVPPVGRIRQQGQHLTRDRDGLLRLVGLIVGFGDQIQISGVKAMGRIEGCRRSI
jgi:hypothetical protein